MVFLIRSGSSVAYLLLALAGPQAAQALIVATADAQEYRVRAHENVISVNVRTRRDTISATDRAGNRSIIALPLWMLGAAPGIIAMSVTFGVGGGIIGAAIGAGVPSFNDGCELSDRLNRSLLGATVGGILSTAVALISDESLLLLSVPVSTIGGAVLGAGRCSSQSFTPSTLANTYKGSSCSTRAHSLTIGVQRTDSRP